MMRALKVRNKIEVPRDDQDHKYIAKTFQNIFAEPKVAERNGKDLTQSYADTPE